MSKQLNAINEHLFKVNEEELMKACTEFLVFGSSKVRFTEDNKIVHVPLSEAIKYECEDCGVEISEVDAKHGPSLCESCYEQNYCECGQRLEDSWGSKGDGFCIMCR